MKKIVRFIRPVNKDWAGKGICTNLGEIFRDLKNPTVY